MWALLTKWFGEKMKNRRNVAIINSVADKSTGKICYGLLNYLLDVGIEAIFCYGYGEKLKDPNTYRIDYSFERYVHAFLARVTGYQGAYSTWATKRLIKYLKKKNINTIYGVGLHGYYLNEQMFFDYVADQKINFVYIMTEEYAFYGKCGYANKCINYLTGCGNCPYLKEYPKSWFLDRTAEIFKMKKREYEKIKTHAVFVGPEYTITAGKKSPLLKDMQIEIIDEAIDTDFYVPKDTTQLRKDLKIADDKVVIVCVAPSNSGKKGTKYYTELARRFENNESYAFIHVGYVDVNKNLPKNYIPIGYVKDQDKLAEYYSIGDLFVFPSLLDTMPNTCLEALSCGTPLLCFDISGMSYLGPKDIVELVEVKSVDQMCQVIYKTKKKTRTLSKKCREYAISRYDRKVYYKKLMDVLSLLED